MASSLYGCPVDFFGVGLDANITAIIFSFPCLPIRVRAKGGKAQYKKIGQAKIDN